MTPVLLLSLLALGAYFVGALPFGYLIAKGVSGIDVFEHGSKNPGATNVMRVVGVGPGLAVFLLDVLKGFAPVMVARLIVGHWTEIAVSVQWAALVAAVAAMAGHTCSVFLHWRGGKGVATAAGICLAVIPVEAGIALATFAIVTAVTRYVSVGSLSAAMALGVVFVLRNRDLLGDNLPYLVMVVALVVLIFVRHRSNIVRLLSGRENRLSSSSSRQRESSEKEAPSEDEAPDSQDA